AHAVADEMQAPDICVLVQFSSLGRQLCRVRLDRAAQAAIAPVDCAEPLPLQGAPHWLEQHRVRSMSMHQDDGFACHDEEAKLFSIPGEPHTTRSSPRKRGPSARCSDSTICRPGSPLSRGRTAEIPRQVSGAQRETSKKISLAPPPAPKTDVALRPHGKTA